VVEGRLARDVLWEVAEAQHGYVTVRQAVGVGVNNMRLLMLERRGTLERAMRGVYRFPQYPVSQYDPYMLAVLWTGADEACLSHETALDAYGISDVNPNVIHVTVAKGRRLRRSDGDGYVLHHEDLSPAQIGWWQEIPTVVPATAVAQCVAYGTPTYLLRQALERGHRDGYLTTGEHDRLARALEERHARWP
jgi:predicted transcriptional regulator of viral defense system